MMVMQAFESHLTRTSGSAATRLTEMLVDGPPRQMVVSADIDGIVSAMMLHSVAPEWHVIGFVANSERLIVHPQHRESLPDNVFLVDLFSPLLDGVSNHVVLYGNKNLQNVEVRDAFREWDQCVLDAQAQRFHAVPSIWARTEGGYEDERVTSMRWKYPLGTAQLMLALLEVGRIPPRFYDRHYLPWLVANCDGGISTFSKFPDNAGTWWPMLASAVGPASITEQIYQRVATARPHDFRDAVARLSRELGNKNFLTDDWNLRSPTIENVIETTSWLHRLTGWGDPVLDGADGMTGWMTRSFGANESGLVYIGGDKKKETDKDPATAATRIRQATGALNANFYQGGQSGSRFNWCGLVRPDEADRQAQGSNYVVSPVSD
jgi:hypothetical protein